MSAKKPEKGYKGHVAGSRKGKVHQLYDKQGAEAAWTLGIKLGLKEGTLRSWFGSWQRSKPAKAAPKQASKVKASTNGMKEAPKASTDGNATATAS